MFTVWFTVGERQINAPLWHVTSHDRLSPHTVVSGEMMTCHFANICDLLGNTSSSLILSHSECPSFFSRWEAQKHKLKPSGDKMFSLGFAFSELDCNCCDWSIWLCMGQFISTALFQQVTALGWLLKSPPPLTRVRQQMLYTKSHQHLATSKGRTWIVAYYLPKGFYIGLISPRNLDDWEGGYLFPNWGYQFLN